MDLQELYQELLLDHYRRPRNCGKLEQPSCAANGANPLCGDRIHVELVVEAGIVRDVKFSGTGCAISTASASLMTEAVIGKPISEVRALFEKFHKVVTGRAPATRADEGQSAPGAPGPDIDPQTDPDLGKLEIFAGVARFPARVKCATLAWHTLEAALTRSDDTISTE